MSSRPSRQAQLRAEQEKKKKQQQYLLIAGGVVAAIVIIAGIAIPMLQPRTPTSTGAAPCSNLQVVNDEGRGHLTPGETPTYISNPPTSGTHNPVWAQAGVYGDNVDITQLVHSMEHGYIILFYNGISQNEIDQLASIQRSDSYKMIVAPNPNMPYKVAIAAWDHLQTCDGVNEQAIRSFTAQFRNQGPEQAP